MKVNPHGYPSFMKTYVGETRYWERIQIPSKFVDTHKNNLGKSTWVLKTEDGTSWSMEIIREGTEYFFSRADWEKFAKHHDLRFGDQIMAFLVGNSVFEVMLYNQTTCCQILNPNPNHTANEPSEINEASRNGRKHKRKYEFRNKSKSSDIKEEIFDTKNVKQEDGVQINRFSTFNLNAKCPYFETVIKMSHQTFMCVPIDFARETGIIHQKRIELRGEKGRRETMQVERLHNRVKLRESKSDDMDLPLNNQSMGDFSGSVSGKKKNKEKISKSPVGYFPETTSNRAYPVRGTLKSSDDLQRDASPYEESLRSYRTPPPSCLESSKNRSQKMFDSSPMTENSEGSSDSSDNTGGQPCHQCRQNDHRVIWCLKCDKRGYCERCISTWYSDVPMEDIQRMCPACRSSCTCKVCLRADILIKARIRDIPAQKKLQYLYSLLSAVLPVVKRIHHNQCSEVELERKLRGNGIDLARMKLNSDEQMCCNFCRIPIIDYHRHCSNCSYDLCLSCCKDIREAATKEDIVNQISDQTDGREMTLEPVKLSNVQLELFKRISDWKANSNGSIPCPPRKYGGCGSLTLVLKRIFKMNWVAKLVKNVEEMVGGCKLCDTGYVEEPDSELRLCKAAHRENGNDNYLYDPYSEDIKTEGIENFRKHWSMGKPVIVKEVLNISSTSVWDPMFIWRGVRETADEKTKDEDRTVKAIDCYNWTEIDIHLDEFIRGYSKGRICKNGLPQMLKLKDWPSPSASEEFLLYQRPELISKLPLLEFIHSKWGLLNVAAKLPHYSLQNDVGPKIFMSYGLYGELGKGDAVHNLHVNMRDMVFLLVHTNEVKLKGWQRTKSEKIPKASAEYNAKEASDDPKNNLNGELPTLSPAEEDRLDENDANMDSDAPDMLVDQGTRTSSSDTNDAMDEDLSDTDVKKFERTHSGALWDVFRRQDIPKLIEYLTCHRKEFGEPESVNDSVSSPLYDGKIYLNRHHKGKLKDKFGIEPWSFEQNLGEAIFIPAGCPFQVRNLQSTVQLGLDFLSPENLGEAARMAEEIRGLPNDHETKLQMLEQVEKISLYAASSAIKEVQKLVLDPKTGPELGFEDPNLTAFVSENLEGTIKRRQVAFV